MTRIKIILLMPQSERYRRGKSFSKYLRYAPLTLTTLAALVPPELEADIKLVDEGTDDFDPETAVADLVGITCITPTAYRCYDIAAKLRARGIAVVLGGVHPTLVPDEAARHADSVVVGYAEESWPRLLRDFVAGSMERQYRQDPNVSLAGMPEPRRDLLNKKGYVTMNTVQAVRGCPWRCSFCVVPVAWPKYSHRPIEEVIAEVEKLPGDEFIFLDLSPIENAAYSKALYRALIPLKKRWGGLATIRITEDPELLSLAAKSGCQGLLIGFESLVPETLERMGKRFNHPSKYLEQVRMLHDHGIAINGCFVMGLDGDDDSVFDRTLDFVDRASIDLPRFAVPTPFPGTALHATWQAQGRIVSSDWRLYDAQHVVFKPEKLEADALQEGLVQTWREAYRLRSIFRRLYGSAASRSLPLLKTSVLANLGYQFYAGFLPKSVPMPCEAEPWRPDNAPSQREAV